ncbi:MAG: hypothetical protein JW918_09115 [Anaerolineae bacterium]|nr:hypothetical protein [Anaerolineae bacterium]
MEELHQLIDLLCQWFSEVSKEPGFDFGVCAGIVLGFALMAIPGFYAFAHRWWGQVSAPYRPQTITQTFTTTDTPAQVVSRSLRAIFVGFLAIVCVICVLAELAFPGIIETVFQNVVP